MARVSEAFMQQFFNMQIKDIKNPIVFVVDMIHGFIDEGALADEAINDITSNIIDVLEALDTRNIFIADAHPPKTREFQSFPSHCVIGTRESEVIEVLQPYIHELFHKNSTNAFTCMDFQSFLEEKRIDQYEDIVIMGCCSDICIMQFALCLNAWLNEHNKTKQRIIIPIDTIDTYHIDQIHDAYACNEFSIANMKANGIFIVSKLEKGE